MKLVMTGVALVLIFFAANAQAEYLECAQLALAKYNLTISASNLVNMTTTRTPEGGPYKPLEAFNCTNYGCDLRSVEAAPIMKYEPNHPDANEHGYVAYPDIDQDVEFASLDISSKIVAKHLADGFCRP
jgi:flagellar basal body rod protein FlgC